MSTNSEAAPCGCEWETGTWFPCKAHAVPHAEHQTPAPGCAACERAPAGRLDVERLLGPRGDLSTALAEALHEARTRGATHEVVTAVQGALDALRVVRRAAAQQEEP